MEKNIFVAEGARLVGDVKLGNNTSIWFNAVLRGDLSSITIGENSNIQDNCTLHSDRPYPIIIGDYVSVGHNAVVHGCVIEDNCLIGINATILNNATIGENSIIGANALVTENTIIPPNSLVVGTPGKVIRELTINEINTLKSNAMEYVELSKTYSDNKIKIIKKEESL